MREREAQAVLLVRAVEQADAEGRVLPDLERTEATRRALDEAGGEELQPGRREDVVRRRSALLVQGLERRYPALRRTLASLRAGALPAVLTCVVALALGLATNVLGPERHINLLAVPLIGLLAWNLLVYAVTLLFPPLWSKAARGEAGTPTAWGPLVGWLAERLPVALTWFRKARGAAENDPIAPSNVVAGAVADFTVGWRRAAGPLMATRVRRTLHLAALAMVAGAVGGMYLRGIAFEYRATWESTWLDAERMQALLGAVLGPAAALMGVAVPGVAALESPGSGDAAPWIHLYAVTTVLVVGLPRALLASVAGWRAARLALRVPVDLDEGYLRHLLADWRGEAQIVEVLPYCLRIESRAAERLKGLLHVFFGARSHVEVREVVEYGEEPGESSRDATLDEDTARRSCRVVLFNLAQTPESEVQGRFLRKMKAAAGARGEELLVLIDVSRYRHAARSLERRRERFNAWREVAAHAGLAVAEIDLEGGNGSAGVLDAMTGALWVSGETR